MKKHTRPKGRATRGGAFGSLIRLLLLGSIALGVDIYLTRGALQGTWQMEMSDEVATHLVTLMQGGAAPAGPKTLRDKIRQGIGRAGGAIMRGAANQVQVNIQGDLFKLTSASGEVVVSALIGLASETDEPPPTCNRGKLLAAFPLVYATCVTEGEDVSELLLLKGWPGEALVLVPLSLPERRLKDLAEEAQARAEGKEKADIPPAEVREAVKEIFTLHFKKVAKTP